MAGYSARKRPRMECPECGASMNEQYLRRLLKVSTHIIYSPRDEEEDGGEGANATESEE
jgi:hypothetical protein